MKYYNTTLKRLKGQIANLSNEYRMPKVFFWIDSLWCYVVHGASPRDYINFEMYKIKEIERRKFLTMKRSYQIENKLNNPHYANTFDEKHIFNIYFKEFISRKWIYLPSSSYTEFESFIKKVPKILVKPNNSSSGRGIYILNDTVDYNLYEKLKKDNVLLEEYITQHSEMKSLNENTVNTIRMYTLIDKNNEIQIISALLRVGGGSGITDNFHGGGVAYVIDINEGIVYQRGNDIFGNSYVKHPSSNKIMVGFKVPMWSQLITYIKDASRKIPHARYVAWDIAILENGFELVEGNYLGDPGMLQAVDKVGKYNLIKGMI